MWTALGTYVWLFVGTLLLEALVIPLGGVAIHHGQLGVAGVVVVTTLASVTRSLVRVRWHRRAAGNRLTLWQRLFAPRPTPIWRSLLWVGALLAFGYVAGHVVHSLPDALRIIAGAAGIILLLGLIARSFGLLPKAARRWLPLPRPSVLLHSGAIGALASLLFLIPWWPLEETSVEAILERGLGQRRLQADLSTLRWIDEPSKGLRNALTPTRALLLAHEEDAPADVFLVQLSYSHDGRPARVTNVYNLSNTAAVEERNLMTWRKWAAWSIHLGDRPMSVEVMDFRGEPRGRGEGWDRLKRWQRAITNWQEVGQFRGVGRSSVRFLNAPESLALAIDNGVLRLELDQGAARLPLGRESGDEASSKQLEVSIAQAPLPGDMVTWAVDRLRAMPWIGSEGMQWLKGVAFRAADEIETLENELVGIDVDEAISEELGDVLETLPLARPGAIPNWPPAPIEPMLSPPLAAEGRWVDLATDVLVGKESDKGGSLFVFSFIRTDPKRTYNQVSVTAWDPRRIQLHIVAGTEEPQSMTGELGSGLISRDPLVLNRLVGAFNGAFQAMHGEFGMMEERRVVLPPKPYAASVVTMADGQAGFGTWPDDHRLPASFIGMRQNMSPLVVDDAVNPYKRHWWGGVPEGWTEETRTVRSGLCYTQEGFMAYFYSPSIVPERLGEAMRRVRCTYGMHLDMNAGHTGFEFYRVDRKGQLPGLGRPLDKAWEAKGSVSGIEGYEFLSRLMVRKMPLMNFPRYIHQSSRDFFYLTRRDLLPGAPVPGPAEAPLATIPWGIVDAKGNEWPHALAVAEVPLDRDEESSLFRLTRIDLKQVEFHTAEGGDHFVAIDVPLPTAAGDGSTARRDAEGQGTFATRSLVLREQRLEIVEGGPQGATLLATGNRQPSEETAGALCLSGDRLLTLFEVTGKVSADGWRELSERAGCQEHLFLSAHAKLVFPDNAKAPSEHSRRLRLKKTPYTGARRIFEDTKILPPSEWAIPQARRVPYIPNAK